MARRRGFLLTIEGVDGSGKSTQIRRIVSHLKRSGHIVTVVREPGGTRLAERIRKLLLDARSAGLVPPAELFLYLAARGQLFEEVIGPALARGEVVTCDRFTDSTLAYQGGGRGFADATLRKLNDLSTQKRHPDLTLILDVPPHVSAGRMASRPDRLESEEGKFFKRVRARYRRIARIEPRRVKLISAVGTPDEVAGRIRQVLDARLKPAS